MVVSKLKRVTNHMRILVQWWCMRICACLGFLLSGGSGGCFDGHQLADNAHKPKNVCFLHAYNINDESIGHHNFTYTENLHRFSPPESSDVGFVNWRWCLVVFVRINSWFLIKNSRPICYYYVMLTCQWLAMLPFISELGRPLQGLKSRIMWPRAKWPHD